MIDLARITSFDWDDGNARKNDKHGVTMAEAEQVFFNLPLLLLADQKEPLMDELANALLLTGRGLPEEIRGMLYMPFVQYLACNVALRRGVDPDAPQHLTRVVTL